MKEKKFLLIFLSLLYLDLIFNLFAYDTYLKSTIINIFLFDIANALLIFMLTSFFSDKVNKIISYVIYSFLGFWYGLYYVFYAVFVTPFSIELFKVADQTLKFGSNIIRSIFQSFHVIILLFLPLILLIIFRKKIFKEFKLKYLLLYGVAFALSVGIYFGGMFLQDKGNGSIYNLYFETNNVSLNIERLGVISATILDVKRTLFGYDEKIEYVNMEEMEDNTDVLLEYDYNNQNLDLSNEDGEIGKINKFIKNETGTKKNKYTGLFKGMNLIYIVAESFNEIAVNEKVTPTLYKLVHDGFYFENFYTSNNLSTIGGEFQALTGLYADNSILYNWRSGTSYYPYGLGTMFNNIGYKNYAYHDNSAYYQDRNVYLRSQGFTNYVGCYNGLENRINCEQWPQSDVEMIDKTTNDYMKGDTPFITYYMTVSGHLYYSYSDNAMSLKNKKYVDGLNYNETIKAYLATQVELDKALELLLKRLEEAGKLDSTVIVLLADHYPYALSMNDINILSSYERDELIEANSNNLIIYNSKLKATTINKVGMSIDVVPTVYNLFGIDYDSRAIMGKDILSTTEGIAIFKDKSWVTNKGTYYASTGKFVSKEEIPDKYVDNINNIVNNRLAISRMIVADNYYRSIVK